MDRARLLTASVADADETAPDGPSATRDTPSIADASSAAWVEEIVEQLEISPEECRLAFESLSAVEDRVRALILKTLSAYRERPAVRALLQLLEASHDPGIRQAAWEAPTADAMVSREPDDLLENGAEGPGIARGDHGDRSSAGVSGFPAPAGGDYLTEHPRGRFAWSLVTAVDGDGRGTIVLSRDLDGGFHTAAFRCDLLRGIVDAAGDTDSDPPSATSLVNRWLDRFGPSDGYLLDAPELAVGLLGGSLQLGRSLVPNRVRTLLDELFEGNPLPVGLPPFVLDDESPIPLVEMPARAELVLEACPSWLDRSPLTCELAREIALRDQGVIPDPVRDAGAFRYLFEHRLSGRLELYARMLLWMAWVWRGTEHGELARTAYALAGQLADEQYAVPSHPFIVALSARSLRAAQAVIGDARACRGIGGK